MWWSVHLEGGPRRVNHAAAAVGDRIYSFGGYCKLQTKISASRLATAALLLASLSALFRVIATRWEPVAQENFLEIN
jgi:hypothetical protein